MFLIVIAFILFRRTSQKAKSSTFNPSTMSDYTIGENGRYENSYQDHQYADHLVPAAPLPHPFIGSPADYGQKIVTLYPKHPAEHGLATSQVANDFTYRPYPANSTGERLSERTDATVLVWRTQETPKCPNYVCIIVDFQSCISAQFKKMMATEQ